MRHHIPSTQIRPEASEALARFLRHIDVVVTIHGYGRRGFFTALLLGGRNRELADHVAGHLRPKLPAYDIVTDLDRIPPDLRGMHAANPVNLPAAAACRSSSRHVRGARARCGGTGRAGWCPTPKR